MSMFKNRHDAGKRLADKLKKYKEKKDVVVLALPRGGIVIGYEIAKKLNLKLDIILVQKIGAPNNPELGIGALSEGGVSYLEKNIIKHLGLKKEDVKKAKEIAYFKLKIRISKYRINRPLLSLKGKIIILVDDGLATGVTAQAAIKFIKKHNPKKIIFASPVSSYESLETIKKKISETVSLLSPYDLFSIGYYYNDFNQVEDKQVLDMLNDVNK